MVDIENGIDGVNETLQRVYNEARAAKIAGICIVPPSEDGAKRPWPGDPPPPRFIVGGQWKGMGGEWDPYKDRPPSDAQLKGWYPGRSGLGGVAGDVSGRLDFWDFDDRQAYEAYVDAARGLGRGDLIDRIETGYCDDTAGGGVRWTTRYPEGFSRWEADRNGELTLSNIKLARRPKLANEKQHDKDNVKTLIEMPAYAILAPTNGRVHPSGKPYVRRSGGFSTIADITIEEREFLMDLARSFDQMPRTKVGAHPPKSGKPVEGERPGDDYNAKVAWAEVLPGWTEIYTKGGLTYWTRPGKKFGVSATTGLRPCGTDLLHIFTSSTEFDEGKNYDRFGAYTVLNHHGDFTEAARSLGKAGYGSKRAKDTADRAERASRGEKETTPRAEIDPPGSKGHTGPNYRDEGGCIEWWNRGDWIPLTNFTARITKQVETDDDVEVTREFEITAKLDGVDSTFVVSTQEFASLNWVLPKLGATAIVEPGQGTAKRVVVAIQTLSGAVPGTKVYTHTGWVKISGGWAYLHAGGAIGPTGPIKNVNVDLPRELAAFILPDPSDKEKVKEAVRAALALLDLAPDMVSANLMGATYRSVLGGADMSSAVIGETGNFKTAYALLMMAHFGAGFDSRRIPANWSNTPNQLEEMAFIVKDALLLVDEYMPGKVAFDRAAYQAKAERVLRNQGNLAGRGRMNRDRKIVPSHPPRGLIMLSGEECPEGESLRARMATSEMKPGTIDATRLTAAQKEAAAGTYALAMARFLKWLASDLDERRETFQTNVRACRDKARTANHKRTADVLGQLMAAWGMWLDFATEIGAITETDAEETARRVWKALLELGSEQSALQEESNPVEKFREAILSALRGGRAHLMSASQDLNDPPPSATSLGWVERVNERDGEALTHPVGQHVGWADEKYLYLIPALAFKAVNDITPGGFTPGRNTLARHLVNAKVSLRTERRGGKPRLDWRLPRTFLASGDRTPVWVTTHTLDPLPPSHFESGPSGPSGPNAENNEE